MLKALFHKLTLNQNRKQFEKKINLKKNLAYFNQLYDAVDTQYSTTPQQKDISLTFGEVDFYIFAALLNHINPTESDIFYDLGSGHGKACLTAALAFNIKNCIGVEILPERHAVAQSIFERCNSELQQKLAFKCDNFLNASLTDATIVFINATAFFNDTWQDIAQKLENELQTGAKVLLSSKQLNEQVFNKLDMLSVDMAYGPSHVYVYQKRG